MPLLVPDASVILKWVVPPDNETFTDQAFAMREALLGRSITAAVPSLWYFEVGNTLARKYPETAAEQLRLLRLIGLEERPWSPTWHSAILDLTRRYGVTFYDASYHALAIVAGGHFVTADERYLARTAAAGHLLHLKDWTAD